MHGHILCLRHAEPHHSAAEKLLKVVYSNDKLLALQASQGSVCGRAEDAQYDE